MKEIGKLGENLVALWLETQGYELLHQGWHCRWGEIDLIALEKSTTTLAFVEVKTRSHNNWDELGLLAITPQKQQKILKTASLFLAQNHRLSEFNCRFDVALVGYKTYNYQSSCQLFDFTKSSSIELEKPIFLSHKYQMILYDYIQNAFQ